jgi:hypothetical protein
MRFSHTGWSKKFLDHEQNRYASSEGKYMRTSSITVFCKQAVCPSAETLVSYHTSSLAHAEAVMVREHLSSCEFCGAELKLLSTHAPLDDEEYGGAEIPAALRCLAEALMGRDELSHIISLPEISCERERLTLTDA